VTVGRVVAFWWHLLPCSRKIGAWLSPDRTQAQKLAELDAEIAALDEHEQ